MFQVLSMKILILNRIKVNSRTQKYTSMCISMNDFNDRQKYGDKAHKSIGIKIVMENMKQDMM